jgi:hypothetical protein
MAKRPRRRRSGELPKTALDLDALLILLLQAQDGLNSLVETVRALVPQAYETIERSSIHNSNGLVPRWDANVRELWLGKSLVKRFTEPAQNQELVVAAFEAAGWPRRLPDPLPDDGEIEPRQRLHDTVRRLNRAQRNPLIRFSRDGSGHGLRWDVVVPGLAAARGEP